VPNALCSFDDRGGGGDTVYLKSFFNSKRVLTTVDDRGCNLMSNELVDHVEDYRSFASPQKEKFKNDVSDILL
jgi:hypothetical protein